MPARNGRSAGGRTRTACLPVLCGMAVLASVTAAGSPRPDAGTTLSSGMEGTKAALVRIELSAVAEIAHIDHSTGEVDIKRGRTTVPLGSGTGVLVSADGIVATTWENLDVDPDDVAVYAANELFTEVIGVPIVDNDGDPARRGRTPDPYWAPHLQHCYDQVTHCVHFRVPQYHVRTYTAEPGGVMAELLNTPSAADDVALLRISGGGGAPTATVAGEGTEPPADAVWFGFTRRPDPTAGPAEVPVTVDGATGRMGPVDDLASRAEAGLSGGPVVDQATGEVLGLAGTTRDDGSATFVGAQDLTAALQEAGVETTPSKFDVVFRRGIDHLSAGQPGGAAQSSLEEALTYYDSALATSHLRQARDLASQDPGASAEQATAAGPQDGTGGIRSGVWVAIILALVLVAGLVIALLRGRPHPAPRHSLAGGDAGRGVCSQCGRPLEPGNRFCGGCGHPVG